MEVSRRRWLQGLSLLSLAPFASTGKASALADEPADPLSKAAFPFKVKTYLNAASYHPISISTARCLREYAASRATLQEMADTPDVRVQFAQLINATPDEIAIVPNTSTAENFIVDALEIRPGTDRIITDGFHFMGSLYMYEQRAKMGYDVQVVRPRGLVIDLADIAARLNKHTKLIAASLVSWATGFKHDLKALCALAHDHGAMVYADIIQAAGSIPIDVRESGVDFAACSSYKWLMGDAGVGFLYVREDRLEQLRRPVAGYHQLSFNPRDLPFDPQHAGPWSIRKGASGYFDTGSEADLIQVGVGNALGHILAAGPAKIAERRKPLTDLLRQTLPQFGFTPMAPVSDAALVCFAYPNAARKLQDTLINADVGISLYENRIRVSPSVYNDLKDIERLCDVIVRP